jgi:hypothetical protein
MKQEIQIDLNMTQRSSKTNPVQVNTWVNKALDAKNNCSNPVEDASGRKLQLNMTFSKNILNRR